MKDIRQGNDLKVAWSIFNQDGEPFRLEGKDVSLYLKNMFGRKELNDFVVTGNIIQWTFYGKDQKNTGKYSLEMVINEGEKGMITTDKCDFVNLVSCSCKLQGGEDAPNVETESIELTSTLEYVAGGGDSIIVKGDAPSSALIKGTYAEASNEAATAFGGVESFLYHEGEDDERTIEVPNPTTASGLSAHAEGIGAIASGVGAHAEGNVAITHDYLNEDTGEYEQTIIITEASGRGAHAEGLGTKSTKSGSHSEGIGTEVNANSGHVEGYYTKAHSGEGTHTEGMQTDGIGNGAHAEGYNTFAKGTAAHAEGRGGVATEYGAHVEGGYLKEGDVKLTIELIETTDEYYCYKIISPSSPNIIAGLGCNLRDGSYVTIKDYNSAGNELYLTKEVEDGTYIFSNVASGTSSHSEGALNIASGKAAHAEGLKNIASGPSSHVEGESNVSGGDCSHVEGYLNETVKTGAHVEGKNNKAEGNYAHVEGVNNISDGFYSHSEGVGNGYILGIRSGKNENTLYEVPSLEDKARISVGDRVYRKGYKEVTVKEIYGGDSRWIKLSDKIGHIRIDDDGNYLFEKVLFIKSDGQLNRASGVGSHVEGIGTQTSNYGESAVGRFNENKEGLIFSVGNGTSDEERQNAFEVYEDGSIGCDGNRKIYLGEVLSYIEKLNDIKANKSEIPTKVSDLEQDIEIGGTPDWQAGEGEEGYIKNRTHYKIDKNTSYEVDSIEESDGEYYYKWSLEFGLNEDVNSLCLAYNGLKTETIDLTDVPEDGIELSVSFGSHKDGYYPLDCNINIWQTSKNKLVNISAQSWGNYEGITANIKDFKLQQLSEEYIPETIARKSELTKLSAEVSGLSERVDALGEGGSSVFEAVYGETTYNEIIEAHNEGKIVICQEGVWVTRLTRVQATQVQFQCSSFPNVTRLTCSDANVWSKGSFNVEHNLETLANGNVKIKVATQTAEVATPQYVENAIQQSGTPSGDPMHYMYEAVGATYNATDEDIPMVGVCGDSYIHKARHWHLNELGDITNEEMRVIYNERYPIPSAKYFPEWFREAKARTTISALSQSGNISLNSITRLSVCETISLSENEVAAGGLSSAFYGCTKLKKILTIINVSSLTSFDAPIGNCNELEYFRFKGLKGNLEIHNNPKIAKKSILYLIENEAAASTVTIRLNNSLYEACSSDADIQAALTAHPNVSLAK